MLTRFLLLGVLFLPVLPVAVDDSAQANRLLVEAVGLMEEAAAKSGMDEVASLRAVLDKLYNIVENHAASDVAVSLITGQDIGFLALWKAEGALVKTLIRVGDLEAALATAKRMSRFTRDSEGNRNRDTAFALVAEAQFTSGDREGATTTASLIEKVLHRELLLDAILSATR
jgi:hypothetical protein